MTERVLWVDDDAALAYPDIIDLQLRKYEVTHIREADRAIDWFLENRLVVKSYCRFLVDVQLPTNGDSRFNPEEMAGELAHGRFAGMKICELLSQNLASEWDYIRPRLVLFTRLLNNDRIQVIQKFASSNNIIFLRRSSGQSIMKIVDLEGSQNA
jgi:hypothetical protein